MLNTEKIEVFKNINQVAGFNPYEYIKTNSNLETGAENSFITLDIQMGWFRLKYPEGRIYQSFVMENGAAVATAEIYKNQSDEQPISKAMASRKYTSDTPGFAEMTYASVAESAAISRALTAAGFGIYGLSIEKPEIVEISNAVNDVENVTEPEIEKDGSATEDTVFDTSKVLEELKTNAETVAVIEQQLPEKKQENTDVESMATIAEKTTEEEIKADFELPIVAETTNTEKDEVITETVEVQTNNTELTVTEKTKKVSGIPRRRTNKTVAKNVLMEDEDVKLVPMDTAFNVETELTKPENTNEEKSLEGEETALSLENAEESTEPSDLPTLEDALNTVYTKNPFAGRTFKEINEDNPGLIKWIVKKENFDEIELQNAAIVIDNYNKEKLKAIYAID